MIKLTASTLLDDGMSVARIVPEGREGFGRNVLIIHEKNPKWRQRSEGVGQLTAVRQQIRLAAF